VLVTSTSSSSTSATITVKKSTGVCFAMAMTITDDPSGGDTDLQDRRGSDRGDHIFGQWGRDNRGLSGQGAKPY
jgi:hypothetical protein